MSITELVIASTIAATLTKARAGTSSLRGLVPSPVRAGRQLADQ